MECRFCFEDGQLISPCKCSGSQKWIHETCLKKWYEMKSENRVCSVCKYRFRVKQLGVIEFVPPHIELYTYNVLNQALLGVFVNLTFYAQAIMISPWSWNIYYDHAAFQILYLLGYYTFAYFRYYRIVQNKRQYLLLLDDEVKKLLGVQLAAVLGLPFVHNAIYHYSAVFLAIYIRQPVMYFHYKTLKAINERQEYQFICPSARVPSVEPTSSS